MPGYSEESRQKVLKAMKEGLSHEREIAKRTGVSRSLVGKIRRAEKEREAEEKLRVAADSPNARAGARREKRLPDNQKQSGSQEKSEKDDLPDGETGGRGPHPLSTDEEIALIEGRSTRGATPGKHASAKDAEIEMLRAQVAALQSQYQSASMSAARSSVAGESVAGRPSLADFREKTWRNLASTVLGLPQTALRLGRERTIELSSGTLTADLAMLALGPPPTPLVAKMRVAVEHCVTDRAKFAVMIGNDAAGRMMRAIFLRSATRYYFGPSVQRLFEKSIETLLPSDLMGMGQEG